MTRSLVLATALGLSLIACTDPLSEQEAEADGAFADGKADQLGFKLGQYLPVDAYYDNERLPLVAAFHAATPDVPAGDHGHFDLVRYAGDIDSTYDSGTFRLYTWQGRNRIRFSSYDGRVLWRADWAIESGKLVLDHHAMIQQAAQPSQLVDCLAVDVLDRSAFEEGLTTYEYPTVEVRKPATGKFEIDVGSASFDSADATITVETSATELVARAKITGATLTLRVPAKAPRRGELLVQETDGQEAAVAALVCRP